jgi:hypothetical protein
MKPKERAEVKAGLQTVKGWMEAKGIQLPSDLSSYIDGLKTVDAYERSLKAAVREFYRGDTDAGEFIDEMIRLIDGQLTRAWNEGMRENKLDPKEDMTPEWEAVLQESINSEYDHVLDFADAIEKGRNPKDPQGFQAFYPRAELWVERYNDVVNLSILTTAQNNLRWEFGDTQHCVTCEALNGIVASAADWEASGYRPQNPPNDALECGGWRCQCSFVPTDEKATEGGIPEV